MLRSTLLALGGLAPVSSACNPEAQVFQSDMVGAGAGGRSAPVTFLLQDKGVESPACLDGSPYGFYFVPSSTGSTKWTISIDGGGWCYDEIDCYCRSKGRLGSSKGLAETSGCSCMNPNEDGTMDQDCNCIHMPYSDGASFSGYRAEPWPVPEDKASGVPPGATVTFRGIKNLDGVLDFAMRNGMTNATEFVLTGGSAGGLSTFLHADRVANRLKAEAPKIQKIRAAPVVGYFLDHDNFKHTDGGRKPNTAAWSQPGTGANYTTWMKYVYSMQNLTFGADGGLTAACQAKHADQPHLCFMSPHMQDVIETPFFMFNSKYDSWQLGNEFQSKWDTKAEQEGVLQYGKDFMAQLAPVYTKPETKHGGMITSCICHGCPWDALKLDGKSSNEHYADWFYGKTSGAESMHIDTRLPNGHGELSGGAFSSCVHFPYDQAPAETTLVV
eukprot:gb/GFBE01021564.1/.p1 GENE.gb/GFBE01021564.1/~~gb/GFBE01021564.1/.p1  ORF type:complete len:442 (+),score=98.20 gb/GFBE01021564.1/:1-1326(+)